MGKKLNIKNQTFNDLTAIEQTDYRAKNGSVIWRFSCKCGNTEVYRPATYVVRGSITCCEKCCKQNCFGNKRYIRPVNVCKIGDKSGHLQICDIDFGDGSAQNISYMCKCDCGSDKLVKISHKRFLITSQSHSCGCEKLEISRQNGKKAIKKLNIKDMRRGKLVAVECLDTEMKATSFWKLECDCGNFHTMMAIDFKRGRANSCGCISSLGELKIETYLKNHKINYKKQVSFPDLLGVNGGLLRFDFGVYSDSNELLFLIEFDGYHHYHKTNFDYKGINIYDYTKEHDSRKNKYCQNNQIILYRLNNEDSIEEDLTNILKSATSN